MSDALSRLMAPAIRDRCQAISIQANGEDGLDLAARWVEELAK